MNIFGASVFSRLGLSDSYTVLGVELKLPQLIALAVLALLMLVVLFVVLRGIWKLIFKPKQKKEIKKAAAAMHEKREPKLKRKDQPKQENVVVQSHTTIHTINKETETETVKTSKDEELRKELDRREELIRREEALRLDELARREELLRREEALRKEELARKEQYAAEPAAATTTTRTETEVEVVRKDNNSENNTIQLSPEIEQLILQFLQQALQKDNIARLPNHEKEEEPQPRYEQKPRYAESQPRYTEPQPQPRYTEPQPQPRYEQKPRYTEPQPRYVAEEEDSFSYAAENDRMMDDDVVNSIARKVLESDDHRFSNVESGASSFDFDTNFSVDSVNAFLRTFPQAVYERKGRPLMDIYSTKDKCFAMINQKDDSFIIKLKCDLNYGLKLSKMYPKFLKKAKFPAGLLWFEAHCGEETSFELLRMLLTISYDISRAGF